MIGTFKDFILSLEVTKQERKNLIYICSDWALFCDTISHFNKLEVMKLLSYLVKERPKSNKLLARSIGRFNRLNALKKGDLK